MGLLDFLTADYATRQGRTRRLREGMEGLLGYYLGPTGIPDRLSSANALLNPIGQIGEAGANTVVAFDPTRSRQDRMQAALNAGLGTVTAAAPAIGGAIAGQPARRALMETITGASGQADVAPPVRVDEPRGILAYHGSPHDFDRFSMSKIGTGEGAQAYGHGLYFAEAEPVARGYRDALSARAAPNDARGNAFDLVQRMGGDVEATAEIVRDGIDNSISPNTQQFLRETLKHLEDGTFADFERPLGRMYEVNINANPEDFLDWDKPLSEQPHVAERIGYSDPVIIAAERAKLRGLFSAPKGDTFEDLFGPLSAQEKAAAERLAVMPEPWKELTGKDAWLRAAQRRFSVMGDDGRWGPGAKTYEEALQMAGGDINRVRTISDPSATARSEFMREAGIPGIKYFDAMSRGAGEGSRNYVVFDENLINIVRKYGIAGAAAMLGVSTMDVEQAMAQGAQPQQSGLLSPMEQ